MRIWVTAVAHVLGVYREKVACDHGKLYNEKYRGIFESEPIISPEIALKIYIIPITITIKSIDIFNL